MNMNKNEKTPISSGEVTNVTRAKKYAGGRFNLVDLCLIILILAAIALILVYLIPGLSSRFQHFDERGIMYTLEFNGVDAAFSANTLEPAGRQKPTLKTASDTPKSESLAGPR